MKKIVGFFAKTLLFLALLATGLVVGISRIRSVNITTETVQPKQISNQILAKGNIRSQNEANLHFATGGKLTYLGFKEGDKVYKGQTVASLDTYTIQRQLQAALNTYRSARDTFDQMQENNQNNILRAQQTYPYDLYKQAYLGGSEKDVAINNAVKRILDQSQATLDNSVIQVELAHYAYTLATLTSPINGVLIHQDVNTPNLIVSPQASFIIVDPQTYIFRAQIAEEDMPYMQTGLAATVKLNGQEKTNYQGTVIKIYPERMTLPTGENVYQVDVASDQFTADLNYQQGGVATININSEQPVTLVPSWLVLGGNQVWVMEDGKPVLKLVETGQVNGQYTEILSGISENDQLITEPENLINHDYLIY